MGGVGEVRVKKRSYAPGETDITIIQVDILAEFAGGKIEHRTCTMVADGEPNGQSAMAKAVGLSPAIAAQFIFDGKITDVRRETTRGFAIGHVVMDDVGDYRGKMEVTFQNVNLVARLDGRPRAIVPELVCV